MPRINITQQILAETGHPFQFISISPATGRLDGEDLGKLKATKLQVSDIHYIIITPDRIVYGPEEE